jgi:predicted hotdog family 3-hydroxylacyl-ACP dehydratase
LDKAQIAALIPHAGAMCLLDRVVRWDSTTISCVASSHRAAVNPLAAHGRLDAVCGVEYASQAMAVHGAMVRGGRPPAGGYLASLRDVTCAVERLDTLAGDLLVSAALLMADDARVIYRFDLTCGARPVLSGRAAVVIQAERLQESIEPQMNADERK